MVAGTLGLLIIAYKASSVSFEIANAKIELSSAIAKTKEIKSDLKLEDERLKDIKSDLEQMIAAPESSNPTQDDGKEFSIEEPKKDHTLDGKNSTFMKIRIPKDRFESLDAKINAAEKAIQK
jgi:hypothetical protein